MIRNTVLIALFSIALFSCAQESTKEASKEAGKEMSHEAKETN